MLNDSNMLKKIKVMRALEAIDIGNKQFQKLTDFEILGPEEMEVSDGYHTMTELYAHRIELFIALCHAIVAIDDDPADPLLPVWRANKHFDGSSYSGWFVLGIFKEMGKQITYHLPMSRWEECGFAETLEKAPEFDGHTSANVLERIKKL